MKDQPMEEREIVAHLGRKIEQSLNDDDGDLSQVRKAALDEYHGQPYGDERDGHSSVVTREVMEAVEWGHPLIMRVFASGDRVVSFSPQGPEDEALADQETDSVRHVLFERNNGFLTLYAWIKDALMYPNAYAKVWADESVKVSPEEYEGLTEIELGQLLNTDDEIELLSHDVYPGSMELLYDVKLRRTVREVRIIFEPCEPDQILVDNDLTALPLEGADFVCHRTKRNYTWLVDNGYDPDKLDQIGTDNGNEWGEERTSRLFYEDENPDEADEDDASMRNFWVHECYVSLDTDGDGLAERRKIVMIGDVIFENEEDDYMPIVALSAIPQSHKHTGTSLRDLVSSHQRVMTALTRNLLDNIYRTAVPRKYVGDAALLDDGTTEDDLQDAAAEFIRTRDPTAIREEVIPQVAGQILAVMQEIQSQIDTRSGINPSMSMDPNILKESTMGAFMGALEQASQRIELITRVMAETGIKDAMFKAHRLMREHMNKAQMIRLRGEWISSDPSSWRERQDLTVEVGTGFHSKEKRAKMLSAILEEQKSQIQLQLGTVTPQNVYNTSSKLADAIGERNPGMFFTDPSKQQPRPPQPDPQMLLLQMQKQVEDDKRAVEREKNTTEAHIRKMDIELKHMREMQSASGGQVVDIEKIRLEAQKQRASEQLSLLDTREKELDRQAKMNIAEADRLSRERIEAAKLLHDEGAQEASRIYEREVREIERTPPESMPQMDAIASMLAEQDRRREKRVAALTGYFQGERTEESLKQAVEAMASA